MNCKLALTESKLAVTEEAMFLEEAHGSFVDDAFHYFIDDSKQANGSVIYLVNSNHWDRWMEILHLLG